MRRPCGDHAEQGSPRRRRCCLGDLSYVAPAVIRGRAVPSPALLRSAATSATSLVITQSGAVPVAGAALSGDLSYIAPFTVVQSGT